MAPPPKIVIAPPAAGGKKNDFDKFIKAHNLGSLKVPIQQWAGEYGVPALWVAAVLYKESKGKNVPWNPAVQGAGVAQLNVDPQGHSQAPAAASAALGRPVTYKDVMDPSTAIQILTYTIAQSNAANVDDFYQRVWNPGFTPSKGSVLPGSYLKGYNVNVSGHTPTQTAAGAAAVAGAKATRSSTTWAVTTGKGAVKFVSTHNTFDPSTGQVLPKPPPNALKQFGVPLTQTDFLQQWASISDDYQAYTQRRPSYAEVAGIIKKGTSQYELRQNLSQTPGFVNSPIWKQNAPGYEAVYKSIFGDKAKTNNAAVRYAVANNVGQSGFQDLLRTDKLAKQGVPSYETSQEFGQKAAAMTNVRGQIYGAPDAAGVEDVKKAVRQGWDENQYAQYLRAQPQWKSSPEAQQLWYGLADKMGFIKGGQNVIDKEAVPNG